VRILKLEYVCDVKMYLGKQSKVATDYLTTTHGTVLQLVISVENKDHKLYIENSHLHNFSKTSVPD
jgi:hypothetical protein